MSKYVLKSKKSGKVEKWKKLQKLSNFCRNVKNVRTFLPNAQSRKQWSAKFYAAFLTDFIKKRITLILSVCISEIKLAKRNRVDLPAKTAMSASPFDPKESIFSSHSPRIFNQPVVLTSFRAVSDHQNGVIILVPVNSRFHQYSPASGSISFRIFREQNRIFPNQKCI